MQRNPSPVPAAPAFQLTTPKQGRAYFHPVRMKILNFLTREALTISQTAERLHVHPANITHHFRILERARLIRLVEKRDIGRVVEKYYAAVAQEFEIVLPTGTVDDVNRKILTFLRDDIHANIAHLRGDDSEQLNGWIMRARIDAKTYRKFEKRLRDLLDEFDAARCETGKSYALNVSLYPHQVDYGPMVRYEINKKERLRVVK
jgi:DNA-binding transcriptional ArsR family regulator